MNGTNGVNGLNGTNGVNGLNGTNGVNGLNGTNGVDGLNGTNGNNTLLTINGVTQFGGTNMSFTVETGSTYFADPVTMKKMGNTFSVADWIPRNLVDVYVQSLVQWGATSKGMLDGPGYLFNDEGGILVDQSTNYTFDVRGYVNGLPDIRDNITLLIQGEDGQGNVPTEGRSNNLYVAGDCVVSTSVFKFGTGSLYFSGGANGLCITNEAWTSIGSGAFTIDFWFYMIESGAFADFIGYRPYDTCDNAYLGLVWDSRGDHLLPYSPGNTWDTSEAVSYSAWHHVAVCGDGGESGSRHLYLFLDGQLIVKRTCNYHWTEPYCNIGSCIEGFASTQWKGYIDEICFRNYCAYTAAFSPPTAPYSLLAAPEIQLMTIVATNKVVDFVPTATWMSVLANGSSLTTNDVQGYVSPDYGTNWYQAALQANQTIDLSNVLFQGTASYTNNTTASNVVLKVVATSNKVVRVLGIWGPSN